MLPVLQLTPGMAHRVTKGTVLVQEEVFGAAIDVERRQQAGVPAQQPCGQVRGIAHGPADAVLAEDRWKEGPETTRPGRAQRIEIEAPTRNGTLATHHRGRQDSRMTVGGSKHVWARERDGA